jgi:c-di-GMP-binding flagellar brake protein YcgR
MSIEPGLSTRIVTDIDVMKERVLVKGSTVHDVREPVIILAQTDPPILKSMLHREVIVTYLVKENGETVRRGFTAELVEFIDYNLNSGQQVKALVVKRTGPEKPYNIRMAYRVSATGRSSISMSVFENEVNIIDISLGGAKITYRKPLDLKPDEIVRINLKIEGKVYTLEARILRTWEGDCEGARRDLWFASAEFVNMSKTVEYALSRKIHDIERESRQRETRP